MAKIVKLGHNIDLQKGVLNVVSRENKWAAWGRNALQTVTITRRTPFNPQQAIGYKGIVDYTSSPITSDVTLDCILVEGCISAFGNSVYNFAENEVVVGEESYVLTSCALNFQAGNPATVNYGYITAGNASELDSSLNPKVLTAGEEARFAVVMGEDGSGIYIAATDASDSGFVIPAGVQTIGFNATLNRNQILDVRSSEPVQFITTYPLDLSMNLEMLQKIATGNLKERIVKLDALRIYAGASTEAQGLATVAKGHKSSNTGDYPEAPSTSRTGVIAPDDKLYVAATGLMKTEDSESVNVGGNLTYTYQFTAADIEIPLATISEGSDSATDPGNDY